MDLVIGVDGGATSTRAVIVEASGQVAGAGKAGGSNYHTVGVDEARRNIDAAVAAACQAAGTKPRLANAAFLGMAGVGTSAEREMIAKLAEDLGLAQREKIGVDHDIRIALAGGLAGEPGIVVIAGTGAACYGRNERGESWKAGGWGWLVGDHGGGVRMALEGLAAAIREHDGRGRATALSAALQKALSVENWEQVVERIQPERAGKAELAALAPVVLAVAEQGDPVASEIVRQQADELAQCVEAVSRRLGLLDRAHAVTYTGSLLLKWASYRGIFEEAVRRRIPAARVTKPRLSPVLGAALLAMQQSGRPVTEAVIARMAESTSAHS